MRSYNRRLSAIVPSLVMLAACGAAPGDEAMGADSESAVTAAAIILPHLPAFVPPTYYTAGSGQVIKMQSATTSICLLQSVSGSFTSSSSTAWIYVYDGYYYLGTNAGGQASAACAPLSDFTGTGTSTISSTASSPYWLTASLPQDDTGYNSNSLSVWPSPKSACFLSGFGGDWSGVDTGAAETNPIDEAYITGGEVAYISTNGSGNKVWVNCYEFPGRSSITLVGGGMVSPQGTQSVNLNANTSVGLCGLDTYIGAINLFLPAGSGGDAAYIVHSANGTQTLEETGSVQAHAYCLAYSQGS